VSGTVALGINRIVNIQVELSPAAPQAENVDTALVLGSSDVIDVTERMREYGSLPAVIGDFGTAAPETLAATAWFGQAPQPTTLNIGRWAQTATTAVLNGSFLSAAEQLISNFTPISAPGFYVVLNGTPFNVTPATLVNVTAITGVAAIVQTALAALVSGTTFVWNGAFSRFQMQLGGTPGVSSTTSFFAPPTALGSATFAAQPANNDTLTIGGTTVTFVTGAPTGDEVTIGATLAATLAALATFLNESTDTNLSKCTYLVSGDVLYITAIAPGAAGDSITLVKSSTEITVSGATLAGGSATDISGLLNMRSTDSGAFAAQGIAAESALTAVTIFDNLFPNQWYGLVIPQAADADHEAIAAFIEADSIRHYYGITTSEGGVLVPTSTTDIASILSQEDFNHTAVQFSSSSSSAIMSYLARILTTNWNGSNTTITLKFKQEPGITPETLNTTEANALEAKNANVYVNYDDDTAIIEQGVSCSGQFTDAIVGLDWLALQLQNDLYTFLFESETKVPETDAGNHELYLVIINRLETAVTNGLIGPGTWEAGGFGTLNQGDFMPTGYYVFQPTVASLSTAQISSRQSVPFQIAINLAGAIHSVNASILVNT
jgi:uncharacterized protein (UPF0333 family)